jgi:hypothetical protein
MAATSCVLNTLISLFLLVTPDLAITKLFNKTTPKIVLLDPVAYRKNSNVSKLNIAGFAKKPGHKRTC